MVGGTSDFTVSIHYDRRLYEHDIAGSMAHVRMLARRGIIDDEEMGQIVAGLMEIKEEISSGEFPWKPGLEDLHMNIESRLAEKIGAAAGKLHTARSRNDQIALDMRMYARQAIARILGGLHGFREIIVNAAQVNAEVVLPGYTHLQRGQPVLLAHHLLAYFEMLGRDIRRFQQAAEMADSMPLGSGAIAGSPYPLDRRSVASELGFSRISANSMDAVSDRDFVVDLLAASATCMMHLSRLSEELILWSSEEFGFVSLADTYTTGSSMMPQKRNPDYAELTRGRTGRVYGNLIALLTTLKGLPLTYNRDLQEDKEGLFDSVDTVLACLEVCAGMVTTMTVDRGAMRAAAETGGLLATDFADYLARKQMPFRQAHGVMASMARDAASSGRSIKDLTLGELKGYCELFEEDVLGLDADSSIDDRNVDGGTARSQVEAAIVAARRSVEEGMEESTAAVGGRLSGEIDAYLHRFRSMHQGGRVPGRKS